MSRIQAVPDWLSRQPPPGYVAGIGRGATGFTTRSDVGPSLLEEDPLLREKQNEKDPENETGLFNSLPYEADDEEADQIYESIDKKMQERRKNKREAKEKLELEQ